MHTEAETIPEAGFRLFRPAWLGWALAALIFAAGLGVRLYDLADPPLDFHPNRQLHSALIARGMYYETQPLAPPERREIALRQQRAEGTIEPQVMERLAAWGYGLAGGPQLWIPRLLSILFWMIGALLLFDLASLWAGRDGALVGALLLLVWPYAVSASRSFQPDPLMVALITAAVWAAARWERRRTWAWALVAGLLGGLAIYVKSVAVFFIAPALGAVVLWGPGIGRALRDRQVWAVAALAVLPGLAYYLDGMYLRGYLAGQLSQRFFPEMWLDPAFYLRWVSNAGRAIPLELSLAALVGALLLPRRADRAVLLALWAGYVACGMALSHHISTHDYYHLPLFVPVSLGLAALAQAAFDGLRGPRLLARLVAGGVLVAALVLVGYEARNLLKRSDYREAARRWEVAGEQVGAGAGVVVLADDYGSGMAYWGWTLPVNWPSADDLRFRAEVGQESTFEGRFQELAAGRSYFVISPLAELERQPDLQQYLADHYPVLFEQPDLVIYDLRTGGP